ncbi:GNAT family N-acetyltransferase [Paenibacillus ginsengarvi]|uniref:GNAT family N-acetyltransferase n=2 Tax=Paenibacillus ginsengarvi TaxID=400777 RepID=A0A3B0CUK3_9BACL|nr:GNAT family N-acetyltransferase [Paenibacillus ginsengarvi]
MERAADTGGASGYREPEGADAIPYFGLTMKRSHLLHIPSAELLEGYSIRPFVSGDEAHWARIECLSGEFKTEEEALRHFRKEFGEHIAEMESRCLFVVDQDGLPVGTTTAWYGTFDGRPIGRIHWVAVIPDHQGRKLAKPLFTEALRTLALFHEEAYLTTQTTSYKAVGMYLNYGFAPVHQKPECREGWAWIERLLGRSVETERMNDQ